MKRLVLVSLMMSTLICNATDYWSISTTLWSNTDGGADCACSPGAITTGDNVHVKHFISSAVMNATGTPNVTIYNGGRWALTGGAMDIDAGSWTINAGGCLAISAGNLTSGGFTVFAINGKLEVVGNMTNNGAITGSGLISYTGSLTNNNPGTIDPLTTLPVELIDFTAEQNVNIVDLKWSTASEINSDRFLVQRSVNAVDFITIGTMSAAGFSEKVLDYTFKDESPISGVSYYRLIEFDRDEATSITSSVISVNIINRTSDLITQIYPNPSIDNLCIFFNSEKGGQYTFDIKNVSGRMVYSSDITAVAGENKFFIPLESWGEGIYFVNLIDPNAQISSVRILKK